MSYAIEYSKHAIRYDGENILAYTMFADNDVYPRTPRPYLVSFGCRYAVMQEICTIAGYCEGGCLKPGGKDVKPEAYIKRWREIIADAVPVSAFLPHHIDAHVGIAITKMWDEESEYVRKAKENVIWTLLKFYGKTLLTAKFGIESLDNMQRYQTVMEAAKRAGVFYWRSMEI